MPSRSIEINVIIEQNIQIIYYAILLFKCSVYDKFNEGYKFCLAIYFHKSIYKLRIKNIKIITYAIKHIIFITNEEMGNNSNNGIIKI